MVDERNSSSLQELKDASNAAVHPWDHHVTNLVVEPRGLTVQHVTGR